MKKTLPSRAFLETFIFRMKHCHDWSNESVKLQFAREGRKILRVLADLMGLPKGSYDLRWNPGGVAGSGDLTLHSENIYVKFLQWNGMDQFMYRSCKGRKDYTGGPNQWMNWDALLDLQEVAAQLKRQASIVTFFANKHGVLP